jgi:Ca-activated chloride channel family protein
VTLPRRLLPWLLLTSTVLASTVHGQQPAIAITVEQVRIDAPEAGAYLSGSTVLRAFVDPAIQPHSVNFFVDGRLACTISETPFECDWDAGSKVVEHQIRLVVSLSEGGRVTRTMRTKGLGFVEKVDVEAIQVTVTVTDDKGHFVGSLPRSAFHVFEDKRPQTISNFMAENVPLQMVVAVDISGSMTGSMPKLKKAVKDFLRAVPSRHEVSLLGFNDSIFSLTRKATDPEQRARAVDRLAPWGATALYDTIIRGIETLGRQTGRKALIIFSDGEDQGSHVTLDDVERRLQASDVTLYMIGQGRGVSVERLRHVMQRLAVPTGGRAFTTDSIDELHVAFDELLDELSHQYLVGYQPTNSRRDDTWREIKVVVDGQSHVRARQGYRASPIK